MDPLVIAACVMWGKTFLSLRVFDMWQVDKYADDFFLSAWLVLSEAG